jgi:hypothetical protein
MSWTRSVIAARSARPIAEHRLSASDAEAKHRSRVRELSPPWRPSGRHTRTDYATWIPGIAPERKGLRSPGAPFSMARTS